MKETSNKGIVSHLKFYYTNGTSYTARNIDDVDEVTEYRQKYALYTVKGKGLVSTTEYKIPLHDVEAIEKHFKSGDVMFLNILDRAVCKMDVGIRTKDKIEWYSKIGKIRKVLDKALRKTFKVKESGDSTDTSGEIKVGSLVELISTENTRKKFGYYPKSMVSVKGAFTVVGIYRGYEVSDGKHSYHVKDLKLISNKGVK